MADQTQNVKDDAAAGSNSTTTANANTAANNQTSAEPTIESSPSYRAFNPLSTLSSYTYNLTLYLTTPEIGNQFVNNGGLLSGINLNQDPIYVIAQSGGVNNAVQQRMPTASDLLNQGEGVDYYIDDLEIKTYYPNQGGTPAQTAEIKFKIIEPLGFMFFQNLSALVQKLSTRSAIMQKINEAIRYKLNTQTFLLGIKFRGYNSDGSLASNDTGVFNNPTSKFVDPNSIIEKYYRIIISDVKYNLDGKVVTYNVTAKTTSDQIANGQMNGTTPNNISLEGSNVYEILMGGPKSLAGFLNNTQQTYKDQKTIETPQKYSFQFLDEQGNDVGMNSPIAKAKVLSDSAASNESTQTADVKSTSDSDVKKSMDTKAIPKNKFIYPVNVGQPIISIIDKLITTSDYISSKLNQSESPDAQSHSNKNTSTGPLKWFVINPVTKIIGGDNKLNNWAYEIVYQIKPFSIPYITSDAVSQTTVFPGSHKKYEYWFTGKNTEIISYSQEYNTQFYTVVPPGTSMNNNSTEQKSVSAGMGQDTTGGGQNSASNITNSVKAVLNTQADAAMAKIKILGDPDYLASSGGVNYAEFAKVHQNDKQIKVVDGQVFISINFKTADDYATNGCLNILAPIQFYQSEAVQKAGLEGIYYMVLNTASTFSKGVFLQTLELTLLQQDKLLNSANSGNNKNSDPNNAKETQARLQNKGVDLSDKAGQTARASFASTDPRRLDVGSRTDKPSYSDPTGTDDGAAIMNVAIAAPKSNTANDDNAVRSTTKTPPDSASQRTTNQERK